MLIPLICKQCGGKLEVEDTKISLLGENFIVLPNQNFECPHCGTEYVADDANKPVYASDGGIAIGSFKIDGDITGNIVIGSGFNPGASSIKASETQKPAKKWWEFWK